jgi:uncharacterized membrane protein
MVEQIYEFLTLIIRKGPEFIAVGFLGLLSGVTLTAFGPRWLRRSLLPQIVDSTQRKVARLEQEAEELKQVADQTKAANVELARDKETFQLTIATQSGRIEELVIRSATRSSTRSSGPSGSFTRSSLKMRTWPRSTAA